MTQRPTQVMQTKTVVTTRVFVYLVISSLFAAVVAAGFLSFLDWGN